MNLPSLYIRNHFYESDDGWRYNDDCIKNVVALVVTSRTNPVYVRKKVIPNHVSLMMIDIGPVVLAQHYYFEHPAYSYDAKTKEVGLTVDHMIDEVLMQSIELSYWQLMPISPLEPQRLGITWLDDILTKMVIQESATADSLAKTKKDFTSFRNKITIQIADLQKILDQVSADLLTTIDSVRKINESLGDLRDEVE